MKRTILILLLFTSNFFFAQDNQGGFLSEITPYGDLTITPMMAYTINEKGSNIPTSFLLANGVKANIGFEIGLMTPISTTAEDAKAFLTIGLSKHFLGFDYGGDLINLGNQRISNHRHNRYFFGVKLIPFSNLRFFSINASAGFGRIVANFASQNVNGKIKARTADVSISFTFGINKFTL